MDFAKYTLALREERMKLFADIDAVYEESARSKTPLNEEDRAKIARMDARIDEIEREVPEIDAREERRHLAEFLRESSDRALVQSGQRDAQVNRDEEFRAFAAGERDYKEMEIDIRSVLRERQLARQGASPDEIRALTWDTTSGSLIVPTQMARSLYEYMEASISAFRIGAELLITSAGEPLQLPTLGAHAIATQVSGQGTTLAGTDPTWARVQLDAYKYGELVIAASEVVSDSAFDIADFLGRDIGRALGRKIDEDLVTGSGSGKPKGMTTLTGAGTNAPVTTGGSLITPTYEKLVDTVYSVIDEYRSMGAAWLMKDSSAGTLRKLRDGAGGTVGAVLWQPSLTDGIRGGQPGMLLDYPVYTDAYCAAAGSNATYATFGHFGQYVIRAVGNPVIERNDSVGFATDQIYFRGKWRVDGDHRAIAALNNLVMNV